MCLFAIAVCRRFCCCSSSSSVVAVLIGKAGINFIGSDLMLLIEFDVSLSLWDCLSASVSVRL